MAYIAYLRKLIARAKQSDIAEFKRFDTTYLPILFDSYTTETISDEEEQRQATLDVIKIYLTLARHELLQQLFEHALERFASTTEPCKTRFLDLIVVLIPYQSAENIKRLYVQCIKSLPKTKRKKRAYRLLEEICKSQSDGCKEFLRKNIKSVNNILRKSLGNTTASSMGLRLRCLNYAMKSQPPLDHENKIIRSAITEAVICCKDMNQSCTTAAYDLLNTIGENLQYHEQTRQFVTMILAGFAGPPELISPTILSLAFICHNFTGALGKGNIQAILENVLSFMSVPSREIVDCCLSFVNVFSTSMPGSIVEAALPAIIKSISGMTKDCQKMFRLKIRYLIDTFVREYGCDSIEQHVPSSDKIMYKRLHHLKRLHRTSDNVASSYVGIEISHDRKRKRTVDSVVSEISIEASKIKPVVSDIHRPLVVSGSSARTHGGSESKAKKTKNDFTKGAKLDSHLVLLHQRTVLNERTLVVSGSSVRSENGSESKAKKTKDDIIKGSKLDTHVDLPVLTTALNERPLVVSGSSSRTEDGSQSKAKKTKNDFTKGAKLDPHVVLLQPRTVLNERTLVVSGSSVRSEKGSESKAKKTKDDIIKGSKLDTHVDLPLLTTALNERNRNRRKIYSDTNKQIVLKKLRVNNENISFKFAQTVTKKGSLGFHNLLNLLLKEEKLENLQRNGINPSTMSSIFGQMGANAPEAFNDLYNLWFDEQGNKTHYLETLERNRINLTKMSSILSGAGRHAAKAFKDLHNLWFDANGNKTQYLKTLDREGITLTNMSSILGKAKYNATNAFKNLYYLWFDASGYKTQYLVTLEKTGINLSTMTSILNCAGDNAAKAFKDLYDVWFDAYGNKSIHLKTLEEQGVNLFNMSSILSLSKGNAAKAFRDLYNVWFDTRGNKTQYLKILEKEGINVSNMSSILCGAGVYAAKAFKDLYYLWFDVYGNKTQYLETLDKEGVNISNMSGILSGAGANAAKAFKDLYVVWFDANGKKTKYLKTLDKEGVNLRNMTCILHGTKANAARTFIDLYNLWFDKEGNKTRYLQTLDLQGVHLRNMSTILTGTRANATKAFKDLYNLWFDAQGNKSEYLKTLEINKM